MKIYNITKVLLNLNLLIKKIVLKLMINYKILIIIVIIITIILIKNLQLLNSPIKFKNKNN